MLPSTMLYHQGYNILQIDARNHGDSEICEYNPWTSFGLYEHLDVLGALDYITSLYPFLNGTDNFGLFGASMVS